MGEDVLGPELPMFALTLPACLPAGKADLHLPTDRKYNKELKNRGKINPRSAATSLHTMSEPNSAKAGPRLPHPLPAFSSRIARH